MKVCVVTTARSEYGLLRWIMEGIRDSELLELQLIVTGGHLVDSQGYTYKYIEDDGFVIDEKIDMYLSSFEKKSLGKAMSILGFSISDSFDRLKPDMLVVLGDRYELLPICSIAVVMGIRICHISGGDLTEGAIDNKIRHSISQLSDYHFTGNSDSEKRLIQFGCNPEHIFNVGEPGIDNLHKQPVKSRIELSKEFFLDSEKKWCLCTLHPETNSFNYVDIERGKVLIEFFTNLDNYEVMITGANLDFGGDAINKIFYEATNRAKNIHFEKSLGQFNYTNFMRNVDFVIGNSSSGVVEALSFNVPVINIGERQKGRIMPDNIISVDGTLDSLFKAFNSLSKLKKSARMLSNPYGNGDTSENIVRILEKITGNYA